MLFWDKAGVINAPLIDKPLDQSRLPSRFAQGRDLFAEPDSEDEALGLLELEDNRNVGIRAPELNPVDHSQTGLGSLSTIKREFTGRQHGDLPDLDLDQHLQYHTDARGDVRYYTQTQLKPITGLSVLDVEDGFGKGYRNATRFINFSVGSGHAGFAIKLNSSGRVDPTMLGSGGGFVTDAFTTIDCSQGTNPVADSITDTLQLLEGSTKISVTGDSSADSVTFDVVEGNIDHGSIGGLTDDDHTIYLLADGSRALSANWDAGAFKITAETFESDVVTGAAPLVVASTTLVSNLNADLLDGNHASAFLKNVLEDTTPEFGGEVDAGAHTIGFTAQTATGDGTTTIDWKLGNKFNFLFGSQGDTFTFTAPTNPCSLILKLTQDGTGGRVATWPATVKWAGGTAPTLSTGGGEVDIIAFYFDGTNYHGTSSLDSS